MRDAPLPFLSQSFISEDCCVDIICDITHPRSLSPQKLPHFLFIHCFLKATLNLSKPSPLFSHTIPLHPSIPPHLPYASLSLFVLPYLFPFLPLSHLPFSLTPSPSAFYLQVIEQLHILTNEVLRVYPSGSIAASFLNVSQVRRVLTLIFV